MRGTAALAVARSSFTDVAMRRLSPVARLSERLRCRSEAVNQRRSSIEGASIDGRENAQISSGATRSDPRKGRETTPQASREELECAARSAVSFRLLYWPCLCPRQD